MKGQNKNCPCKRVTCQRHGDCIACYEHHQKSNIRYETACEQRKKKKEN